MSTHIEKATVVSHGFGRFVRSLVGLDRAAVVQVFSNFVTTSTATGNQIEFIDMVVGHLTEKGVMDPRLLYESPFKDVAPLGPEDVFSLRRADELIEIIEVFNQSTVALQATSLHDLPGRAKLSRRAAAGPRHTLAYSDRANTIRAATASA